MQLHNFTFSAIGTEWTITTSQMLTENIRAILRRRIAEFDQTYSRFLPNSLVTQMSHTAGEYLFPEDSIRLFDVYDELYEITSGKVTPLIGSLLDQAGYDATYTLQPKRLASIPKWPLAVVRQNTSLTTTQLVLIDVGACGKGYLVDIICELLDDYAITDYVVDASGDLRQKGNIENIVGLEHPLLPGSVIGAVDIRDRSLCASATNRRAWGKYHHIFEPDLKRPVQDIIATWVIADEALHADGLATALFFTDPNILARKYDFEYVRMHATHAIDYSRNFSGQLY